MKKSEYEVTLRYCHVQCKPEENKCKDCKFLKVFEEVYKGQEV